MKNIILFCLIGLSLAAQSPKHFLGFTISPAATDVIHKTFDEHFPASLYEGTFFIGGSVGASMLWQLHPRIRLQTDLVYSVYSERQKRAFNPISNDPVFGFILEPNDEA
ncbi:MAG: hypothetical protein LAT54_03600, partial [Cryomorphaceae bacterium]|nr:hypothetical protein [Cryomorphaceae bacterium]